VNEKMVLLLKIFKDLARYRSENNVVGPSK